MQDAAIRLQFPGFFRDASHAINAVEAFLICERQDDDRPARGNDGFPRKN